jgi:hypothetical protein
MSGLRNTYGGVLVGLTCLTMVAAGAPPSETFTATGTVKTAAGATATAPVTVVVDRTMSQKEADSLLAAFKAGGVGGLRKALQGVPPTGSIRVGTAKPTPTRLTIERATDKGRLLTMVADTPIVFLGGGVPGAKPKEGYDFAVLDLEVGSGGSGAGTLTPAASIAIKGGTFVVEGYSSDPVRLTSIAAAKPRK